MSSEAPKRGLPSQMAVIFFVSAGALLFQVAQTRLFSAAFGYHLTYLVISVALLGVGWGATLSAVFDARPRRPSLGHLAVAAPAGNPPPPPLGNPPRPQAEPPPPGRGPL